MVVRSRFSGLAVLLVAYTLAGGSVWYFVTHAQHGDRGLETRKSLRQQLARANEELAAIREEKRVWERRVAMLQSEAIDRDLLEERARRIVNRVHRDDIVVFDAAGYDD